MKNTHIISGLPRSGSTLLSGILNQNPAFRAGITTPVLSIIQSALHAMGPENEFSISLSDAQKRQVLLGIFEGFYADATDTVFDTNRAWCAQLPLLSDLFPSAKVIACVRNPAWIIDSFERLHAKQPLTRSKIYSGHDAQATVYSRTEYLLHAKNVLGFSLNALREAYYGPYADRLLVLEYDVLCQRPQEVMSLIYEFLDEPVFNHDIDNVDFQAAEFDRSLGVAGLHDVSGPVRFSPRSSCLPTDVFKKCEKMDFWRRDKRTQAVRIQ